MRGAYGWITAPLRRTSPAQALDPMRRHQALIAILLSGLGQSACINEHNSQPSSQSGPQSLEAQPVSEALKPGDPDYPLRNPAPTQVVQFTAIVPSSLSSEFHLLYVVEFSKAPAPEDASVPLHSPPGCHWTPEKQFHVDLPVTLEKSGDQYTGSFSPDLFQPGDCRWHLDRITSSIANVPLVFLTHSLYTSPHPLPGLDLTTDVRRLWCTRKPKGQIWLTAPNQSINCVPLLAIGAWAAVPDGLEKSVPVEESQQGSHIATQYLKTLTIEFHDFDAYASAYVASRQRTSATGVP
jgi:hypothetical protein